MRDPRFRFTDEVRTATRAIAARMIHTDTVATSPEALDGWIARTDDLRAMLTNSGYGSAFDAEDLFPLFESYVAKAKPATPSRSGAGRSKWLWIGLIVIAAAVIIAVIFASAAG